MAIVSDKLKKLLEGSGLEYQASSYYLRGTLKLAGGRTQMWFIDPKTDSVGDYEDHDILSPIADLGTHRAKVEKKAFRLLEFNGKRRLGHVCVMGGMALFKADCSVDVSPEAFRSVVEEVCRVADALENSLTEGDSF